MMDRSVGRDRLLPVVTEVAVVTVVTFNILMPLFTEVSVV